MYESPCTASGSLRPDVGTQSLAASMLERFDKLVHAWDVYRRYPFTICGGVLIAAAPFLSKGN